MESARRDIALLDRVGGDLALDFANTLGGLRDGPWDDEWLHDYADLAAWAHHAGGPPVASPPAGPHGGASAAFRRAIALREHVYAVMAALAAGDEPPEAELAALEAAHRDALAHARLVRRGASHEWVVDDGLDRPMRAVALAAVDLLRSDRLARLKQCRNCRWLFLDTSKNASRRWCSMAHCGTGAKIAATRERRRAARA